MENIHNNCELFQSDKKPNVYQVAEDNRKKWSDRKNASKRYSNNETPYFNALKKELTLKYTPQSRKDIINRILASSERQKYCSKHVDYLIATKDDVHKKKLIKADRCNGRKTCPVCASIDGLQRVSFLRAYFEEATFRQRSKPVNDPKIYENPKKLKYYQKSPVLAYPITISPENYKGKNIPEMIQNGNIGTDKLLNNIFKAVDDKSKKRGSKEAQKAIKQLQDNFLAGHFSKEFEPGKDNTLNVHWHGIIFMRNAGSWKDTLDYESMRHLLIWANGGKPVSNKFGNSTTGDL